MQTSITLKRVKQWGCLLLTAVMLAGCTAEPAKKAETPAPDPVIPAADTSEAVKYEVDPTLFSLSIYKGNTLIPVTLPDRERRTDKLVRNEAQTSWAYPDDDITVTITPEKDYLQVAISSVKETDNEFQWPNISGASYYIPFGEGKRIPQNDPVWNSHLSGNAYSVNEQLSMPFWVTADGDNAVLYIMENPYRNDMVFSENTQTQFSLLHQYPEIDPHKENRFRIYVTDNDPVAAAKIYRSYVAGQKKFVTLEQKAEQNPNIRKLYGAPHIYLWGENLIAPENIEWPAFRKALVTDPFKRIKAFTSQTEAGSEAAQALDEISGQDYVSEYQKTIICRFLSEVLVRSDLFEAPENIDPSALIQFNKKKLAADLPEVFEPSGKWMEAETVDLIRELKDIGIDNAWIGLNSWEQAFAKPELAEEADKLGYLVGPYDSYHSIHEPGKEQWITAKFEDVMLYKNAAIQNRNGEFESGFQNVGRKLNPCLSMPSVEQRVGDIMTTGIPFNSWFIDCDATGEIYDDYSPEHPTTRQEDLAARLERMAYIRDKYNMVIGSEGGNDFAASTIAFAHGIELQSFSWIDEDMKSNKDSEFYIGKYYNSAGGVAEHFSKQIPVKKKYYAVFADPKYDLPLYKLVYNDSVITGYHWDWSTFKIKGSVKDRMLREVLYNTPPLYHLDREELNKYMEDIAAHTKIWSQFSRQAVLREMTGFKILSEDGSVQMTEYGDGLSATANFSDSPYTLENTEIPAHSLLLTMDGSTSVYTPSVIEQNQ